MIDYLKKKNSVNSNNFSFLSSFSFLFSFSFHIGCCFHFRFLHSLSISFPHLFSSFLILLPFPSLLFFSFYCRRGWWRMEVSQYTCSPPMWPSNTSTLPWLIQPAVKTCALCLPPSIKTLAAKNSLNHLKTAKNIAKYKTT